MTHTNFNPGTAFELHGKKYLVVKKHPFEMDHRFLTVCVNQIPETVNELNEQERLGWPCGYFFLHELQDWLKKGIVFNVKNNLC